MRSEMKQGVKIVVRLLLAIVSAGSVFALELEVTRLDGELSRGRLIQVVPEIVLAGAGEQHEIAWTDVMELRPLTDGAASEAAARDYPLRFELADGSAFGGRIESVAEGGFNVAFGVDQTGKLDAGWLSVIQSASAGADALAKLREIAAERSGSEDVAIVERGRKVLVLRGAARGIDAERVTFVWKERELPLPWGRLAGVCFAKPTPRSAACSVYLQGGDVFRGRVVGGDDAAIVLRTGVLGDLELEWSRIRRIECRSRRLVYLSDLEAIDYEFTPFFQKEWEYALDRTLTGRPIRLGGRLYAKGVTMHSRAALIYRVGQKYRQFAAAVGIVDEMNERGSVSVAVLGDGRVLWKAEDVRGGTEPREVLIDIAGVRELSLHVDYGRDLDLSDHVCWGAARLIK